jgi:hypothetical protein
MPGAEIPSPFRTALRPALDPEKHPVPRTLSTGHYSFKDKEAGKLTSNLNPSAARNEWRYISNPYTWRLLLIVGLNVTLT